MTLEVRLSASSRRELRKVNPRGFGRVQSAMMWTKSGGGMQEILERRIDQAMGRMAADLVVRNARILDLATGVFHSGDIAICGETIVGTRDSYRGVREIEAGGRFRGSS